MASVLSRSGQAVPSRGGWAPFLPEYYATPPWVLTSCRVLLHCEAPCCEIRARGCRGNQVWCGFLRQLSLHIFLFSLPLFFPSPSPLSCLYSTLVDTPPLYRNHRFQKPHRVPPFRPFRPQHSPPSNMQARQKFMEKCPGIPVVCGLPVGHDRPNYIFPMGWAKVFCNISSGETGIALTDPNDALQPCRKQEHRDRREIDEGSLSPNCFFPGASANFRLTPISTADPQTGKMKHDKEYCAKIRALRGQTGGFSMYTATFWHHKRRPHCFLGSRKGCFS